MLPLALCSDVSSLSLFWRDRVNAGRRPRFTGGGGAAVSSLAPLNDLRRFLPTVAAPVADNVCSFRVVVAAAVVDDDAGIAVSGALDRVSVKFKNSYAIFIQLLSVMLLIK